MFKALLKKQLLELFSAYTNRNANSRRAKNRSKNGTVALFVILFIYVFGAFGFMFYTTMSTFCGPFLAAGLGWLYFAVSGLMATALGVIGSIFMAQSMLFSARDNNLLLSMPIPPGTILLSRMSSLYIQNFIFEALAFVPACIVYFQTAGASVLKVINCLLLLFLLPLFSLSITCVLGWLVALLASHMKNKTPMTVVLSLALMGAYIYFFTGIDRITAKMVSNSAAIGLKVKAAAYPFYLMGFGAMGKASSFLLFVLLTAALFGLVYFALSRSFLRISTRQAGSAGRAAKAASSRGAKAASGRAAAKQGKNNRKVRSPAQAVFHKELRHFFNSSVYLLNCGLGTLFLLIGAVFVLVKPDYISALSAQMPGSLLSMVLCLIVAAIGSMNFVTAPSISLEGSNMWILQSMPVSPNTVLNGKLRLHMAVSAPASVLCSVCMCFAIRASAAEAVFIVVIPVLAILLSGCLGLFFNLKKPNLDCPNETVAVKQSTSVIFTMLSVWGALALLCFCYVAFGTKLGAVWFMTLCTVLLALANGLLLRWIHTKGAAIFAVL